MKILFKNKTKYTKKIYEEFLEFHQEKYGPSYYFYTAIIFLALLFCVVAQFQAKNYLMALFIFAILAAIMIWRFKNPTEIIKKELKSQKLENEQEFIFKFKEKKVLVYSKKINRQVYYWQLHKVYDSEDFFYLYIDKTHAFLLDKQNFEIGTPEAFTKFMNQKCRFKFSSK